KAAINPQQDVTFDGLHLIDQIIDPLVALIDRSNTENYKGAFSNVVFFPETAFGKSHHEVFRIYPQWNYRHVTLRNPESQSFLISHLGYLLHVVGGRVMSRRHCTCFGIKNAEIQAKKFS